MALQNTYDIPKKIYVGISDTNFVSADNEIVIDFTSTLLRNSVDGYVINDGPGNFNLKLSQNGSLFYGEILMKKNEVFSLKALDVHSVMFEWISDSAYRVFAI